MENIETNTGEIVRFQWAIKRLLRRKENFDILEGLLYVVLQKPIKVIEIIEEPKDKETWIDYEKSLFIIARNENYGIILVQLQLWDGCRRFQLIREDASKIKEKVNEGLGAKIEKCYSMSILNSPLGSGSDYVYKGEMAFKGVNTDGFLRLSESEESLMKGSASNDSMWEHYLLKPDNFDGKPKTPLEEWMVYLQSGKIFVDATAPGLQLILERLRVNLIGHIDVMDYLDYRYKDVKEILDKKVERLLEQLENLDDTILRKFVKDYSELYAKGYNKGLVLGSERYSSPELSCAFAKGLADGYVKGYFMGRLEASFEIAFRMKVLGQPLKDIEKVCNLSHNLVLEIVDL